MSLSLSIAVHSAKLTSAKVKLHLLHGRFSPSHYVPFTLFVSTAPPRSFNSVHHMRLDQEKCGSEAVKFFETNIETISNSLIHRHCTNFAFRCNSFASIDSPTDQMNSQKLHPSISRADAATIASFMASSVLALLSSLFTLASLFFHLEYK